ncbi:unnamed protein product [Closterium sp. NIES-54]
MYRLTKEAKYILLIVYVDELLYIGSTNGITNWFEGELQRDLSLTGSSTVTQYLGLNILDEENAIYLSAAKYADTIAKLFGMTPASISIPYRYIAGNHQEKSNLLEIAGLRDYKRKLGCDSVNRSQWLSRDVAARLAACNHLPLAERAHFGQHKTAKALCDAVVARYSSPATAALGCLILPYLFPELSSFATVEDLITHLCTNDTRYRSTLPAEGHFLTLDPTDLTIDLLEKHLLAPETSVVAVGVARGTPRTPFFEGCSPSTLAPSYASTAALNILGAEDVGAASALGGKRRSGKGKGAKSGGGGSGGGGGGVGGGGGGGGGSGGSGGGSGGFGGGGGGSGGGKGAGGGGSGSGGGGSGGGRGGAIQRGGSGGGQRQQQQRLSKTPTPQQLRDSTGQTCGKFNTQHCCFSHFDDARRTEFGDEAERPRWLELLRSGVDIIALDYDAILAAMYALSISAEGVCYLCVPLDPGIEATSLGASESALPGTEPAEALHTFMLDSGASRCFFCVSTTLTPLPAPVPVRLAYPSGGPILAHSSTVLPCPAVPSVSLSGLHLPSFSTNLVSTAALQDAMVTTTTHGGQRKSICTCTRTGRHLATFTNRPGPSLYTLTAEPPQVAASAQVSASLSALACPALPSLRRGAAARRSSLLLVSLDDCSPADSPHGLRLQLRERFRKDLPLLRLHSDRGGEFSSDLLRDFCRGEGILQSFMLSASPQQNGIAERRIGLVMEVARTSMIHAAAPHFLWPFAVRYAAHQLDLWPRVSLPETSPTLRWTGKVGDASVFRVDPLLGTVPVEVAVDSGAGGSAAGGTGAGGTGATRLGGAGVTAGAGGTGGAGAAGPGGARTRGTGAAKAGGVGGAGAGGTGAGESGVGGTSVGGAGARGAGVGDPDAGGTGAGDPGAGGAGAGGAGASGPGVGGTVQRRPFFVPPPPSSLPPPDSILRQPDSPLPAPSPYAEQADYLLVRREPSSCPASRVRAVCTGCRVPRPRPPPVPSTHVMALHPSSVPLQVPLPSSPESSLPAVPDPESDLARAASPTVPCFLATVVTDPSFESTAASALVAELVDFFAACRLDYATSLVAESKCDCPLSVGDPDAPDIPTPRSYAEAITGPYSSQWKTAMDAEMASWKSTGTYIDVVPPSGANIVDGMWIFRVKRPPGSPPVFKARYVARGFSQRQGFDFFQTFSPTSKMTTTILVQLF